MRMNKFCLCKSLKTDTTGIFSLKQTTPRIYRLTLNKMSDKGEHRRTLRLKEEPEEGTYKEKLRDLNTEKI